MEPEDWPDDEPYVDSAPVPPPADRLWRHPSELFAEQPLVPSPPGEHPGRALVGVAVMASVAASALLVTGLLAVTVGLGAARREAGPSVSVTTSAPNALRAVPAAGAAPGQGLAIVTVTTDDGGRTGAAVAVSADGTLVTTASLVHEARTIFITLDDGTRHPARLLGVDPESGTAVVTVTAPALRPAAWASAALVQPGDGVHLQDPSAGRAVLEAEVVALGDRVEAADGATYRHLVALDSPAWAVVEGAAVVDDAGGVLGLATLDADGDVWAVPIDIARGVARSVATDGRVRPALLGVKGANLTPGDAASLAVSGGAVVDQIDDDGPAAAAGFAPGDVIVSVDGQPVRSVQCLVITIRAHQPGDQLRIGYLRDGERRTAVATLGERALDTSS